MSIAVIVLRPSFSRSSETLDKKGDTVVVVVRMVRNFSNELDMGIPRIQVFNPTPSDWSPLSSANERHLNTPLITKQFLKLLGQLAFATSTCMVEPTTSILASFSQQPSPRALAYLVQAAQFHLTLRKDFDVQLCYYQSQTATTITIPMEVILFTDAGETQDVDGGGRSAYITKVGPIGSPGGAIHHITKSTDHSFSTPVDELDALHAGHLAIINLRLILAEIAGFYQDPYEIRINVEYLYLFFTDGSKNYRSGHKGFGSE